MAFAVDLNETMTNVTVDVRITGQREFRARLWIGAAIMRLALMVIGARGHVAVEIGGDEP